MWGVLLEFVHADIWGKEVFSGKNQRVCLVNPQGPKCHVAELCTLLEEEVRLGEECGNLNLANAKVKASHTCKHTLRKLCSSLPSTSLPTTSCLCSFDLAASAAQTVPTPPQPAASKTFPLFSSAALLIPSFFSGWLFFFFSLNAK